MIAGDGDRIIEFVEPQLVGFRAAADFVSMVQAKHAFTVVALDQPTIVPNLAGMRPVEKVTASVISYAGGGVQPANRSRLDMFGDGAPVWRFIDKIGAIENPLLARRSNAGHFLMEVFPALALTGLQPKFAARLRAPRYNPGNRRRFRHDDWLQVIDVVAKEAAAQELVPLLPWVEEWRKLDKPRKSDQDKLDAVLCALIGYLWIFSPATAFALIGDFEAGYMVTPTCEATLSRLLAAGRGKDVPVEFG